MNARSFDLQNKEFSVDWQLTQQKDLSDSKTILPWEMTVIAGPENQRENQAYLADYLVSDRTCSF